MARTAGIAVAATGGLYLASWLTGHMASRGFGDITIKTNAALGLLVLGTALALESPAAAPWRRWSVRVLGGLALLLGALTLSENVVGWDLGIDQLLATEPRGALGVVHPNRVGTPASLSFLLAGLALVLLGRASTGRRVRLVQALATAVLGIAFLSTIGHLYEAPQLYGLARLTAIAPPTSFSLLLLGLGLLCVRPGAGAMALVTDGGAAGATVRRMLSPVLLLPVLLGWLRLAGERLGLFDAGFGNAAVVFVLVAALAWLTLHIGRLVARSEARLLESRRLLQRTEAMARLGSWELDLVTGALAWSDEVHRILGLARGAGPATYETFLGVVHPEDRAAVDEAYRASLRDGAGYEIEHRVVRPDGEVRWVHEKCEHARDAAGRVVRSFGMILDVTDRRAAETEREGLLAEVERERALLEAVIEHLPVGVGIAEAASGRLLRINAQTRRILRMESTEARDALVHGRFAGFHPDGRPYGAEDWQIVRALRGEVIRGEELHFLRGDGTRGVMRSNAGPVRDRAGRVVAAVVAIDDVTREKEAGEALRRSEERYRTLFDSMSEGFALHEAVRDETGRVRDYRFLEVNPAFETMTGLTRDMVLGRRALEVLPALEPAWIESYGRVVDTGVAAGFESFSGALGRWFQVSVYRTEPERFAVVFVDVTARRLAEDALRAANERLEEAARGKDEFLALLSHELRNPLAPIRNSLFVLERAEPGSEHARRALAIVGRQTAQLARLVDDLLDVTRIVRGRIPLRRERLELNDLVRSTVEDHRSLFEAGGLRLEATFSRTPVHVLGDWNRLAQAVGNLLQNAVKFTPRGGRARVEVSAEPDGAFARIAVGDTGVGMSRETLARLFEPFVQADTTLDRTRGGLGLGLALVKGIAELHGGAVRATSEGIGRGAEIVLRLPRVLETAASDLAAAGAARGPRRRVLVIEDNNDAAESLAETLTLLGHEVATACDGPNGIERARGFRPDVVLCDIGLPGMNGFEVARALREEPALGQTLLVALTGYVLPDDLKRAMEAGFDRHLAKPASLGALEEALAAVPGPRAG